MKFASFKTTSDQPRLGIVYEDTIIDLETLGFKTGTEFPKDMLSLIDGGREEVERIAAVFRTASENLIASIALPFSQVELLAPIPRPRKNIFGIGLNYTEHVAESARSLDTSKELPQQPVIFSKPPTAVTATNQPVYLNRAITNQLDWEVELAVIIGKGGKNIPREKAMDAVFGYTIINDISARDCRRAGQWIVSKGQDTFAPMGPVLVTADEIKDPQQLDLSLTLNGEVMQQSNTKFMLFDIAALIEDLSRVFTLESGDIIATGTPAGVGAGRSPQVWLKDGDEMRATVECIGTLVNRVEEI